MKNPKPPICLETFWGDNENLLEEQEFEPGHPLAKKVNKKKYSRYLGYAKANKKPNKKGKEEDIDWGEFCGVLGAGFHTKPKVKRAHQVYRHPLCMIDRKTKFNSQGTVCLCKSYTTAEPCTEFTTVPYGHCLKHLHQFFGLVLDKDVNDDYWLVSKETILPPPKNAKSNGLVQYILPLIGELVSLPKKDKLPEETLFILAGKTDKIYVKITTDSFRCAASFVGLTSDNDKVNCKIALSTNSRYPVLSCCKKIKQGEKLWLSKNDELITYKKPEDNSNVLSRKITNLPKTPKLQPLTDRGKVIRHIHFINKGGFAVTTSIDTKHLEEKKNDYYTKLPEEGRCVYSEEEDDLRHVLLGHSVCAQCLHTLTGIRVTRYGMKTTRKFDKNDSILIAPKTFNPVIPAEVKESCKEVLNVKWVDNKDKNYRELKAIENIKPNKLLRLQVVQEVKATTYGQVIESLPPNLPTFVKNNEEPNVKLNDYQQVEAMVPINEGMNTDKFIMKHPEKEKKKRVLKTIINPYSYKAKLQSHV